MISGILTPALVPDRPAIEIESWVDRLTISDLLAVSVECARQLPAGDCLPMVLELEKRLDDAGREKLYERIMGGKEQARIASEQVKQSALEEVRRGEVSKRLLDLERSVSEQLLPEITAQFESFDPKARRRVTKGVYLYGQRAFEKHCQQLGVPSMPASAAVLASYIMSCAEAKLALSTVKNYLSGIALKHREFGHLLPMKEPLVRAALQRIGKNKPSRTNPKTH